VQIVESADDRDGSGLRAYIAQGVQKARLTLESRRTHEARASPGHLRSQRAVAVDHHQNAGRGLFVRDGS
jgi:hypothetical protein